MAEEIEGWSTKHALGSESVILQMLEYLVNMLEVLIRGRTGHKNVVHIPKTEI